jgi:Ca2+-binding EF-hand superfamily protein
MARGGELTFNDCLAFLDYILTDHFSNCETMNAFKMFDKNGTGHIATAELLGVLRKELPAGQYERYAQMISAYGPAINYIDILQKKNAIR